MVGSPFERVLLIGLDCMAPRFAFGPEGFELPHLRRLMSNGVWGRLQSCDPPITIPAWSVMTSGMDPGTLGIYGFHERASHDYDDFRISDASALHHDRLWDLLGRVGKRSVVLGVPQTYPVAPVNGWLVSGLLTPDTAAAYTYPDGLKGELTQEIGDFIFDVPEFRTEDKKGLLLRIHELMENRFDTAQYLLESKPWDFFMMVEMGVDRLHHGFWKYCDPDHPKYEAGNDFESAFREYYEAIDRRIGLLVEGLGTETAVLVVSDHGAKALHGGFCINQWLIRQGYLTLKSACDDIQALDSSRVDWSTTRAWASGGYCARIYLNRVGREPQGIVRQSEYEGLREDLISKLEQIKGLDGSPLSNRALRPQDIYRSVHGYAPDIIVYIDELRLRAVGSVGHAQVFTSENDTGPDDANHDFDGVFILDDASCTGEVRDLSIMDVAPTVLNMLNVETPQEMTGRSVFGRTSSHG